jgi:hypothetical protein
MMHGFVVPAIFFVAAHVAVIAIALQLYVTG